MRDKRATRLLALVRPDLRSAKEDLDRSLDLSAEDRKRLAYLLRRLVLRDGLHQMVLGRTLVFLGMFFGLLAYLGGFAFFGGRAIFTNEVPVLLSLGAVYTALVAYVAWATFGSAGQRVRTLYVVIFAVLALAASYSSNREILSGAPPLGYWSILPIAYGGFTVALATFVVARLTLELFERYIARPLITRRVGMLLPVEAAAVYVFGLLVLFCRFDTAWRRPAHLRQVSLAIQEIRYGLQRDLPRLAQAVGARSGSLSNIDTRESVADLCAVLGDIEISLLTATTREKYLTLRTLVAQLVATLSRGHWVVAEVKSGNPATTRVRRFAGAAIRIIVPLGLAVAIPFLPIGLPPEGEQLTQVLFVLTAILSVPGVEPSVRNDAIGLLRQASGRS